jgi:hypothetical protein
MSPKDYQKIDGLVSKADDFLVTLPKDRNQREINKLVNEAESLLADLRITVHDMAELLIASSPKKEER